MVDRSETVALLDHFFNLPFPHMPGAGLSGLYCCATMPSPTLIQPKSAAELSSSTGKVTVSNRRPFPGLKNETRARVRGSPSRSTRLQEFPSEFSQSYLPALQDPGWKLTPNFRCDALLATLSYTRQEIYIATESSHSYVYSLLRNAGSWLRRQTMILHAINDRSLFSSIVRLEYRNRRNIHPEPYV